MSEETKALQTLLETGDTLIINPINTLINKISDAVGVFYEPKRIVRIAEAEAATSAATSLSSLTET